MKSPVTEERPRRRGASVGTLIRGLRARGLLLPAGAGLAVAATLAQGVLARDPVVEDPLVPPVESRVQDGVILTPPAAPPEVLQSLRLGLEKTPLSYLADYWLQLGAVARPKLVRLGDGGLPGIVVMRGLVVAPLDAAEPFLAARRAAAADEGDAGTTTPSADALMGLDTELGIALLRLPDQDAATAFAAAKSEDLAPGSLLAAISLAPRGGLRVVPGHLASIQRLRDDGRGDLDAAVALPPGIALAALVNLDGALVGVAVSAEGGTRVRNWSYETVARAVAQLASDPSCRGLRVAALQPEVGERLGVEAGVVVEALHPRAWGPEPAFRPGDVLLEWGGETVVSPSAFRDLYASTAPGARASYRLLRDRQRLAGSVEMPGPGCLPLGEPPARLERLGLELEWGEMPPLPGLGPREAWRVLGVQTGGAGAAAGLAAGDWILAVDGRGLAQRSLAPFQGLEQHGRAAALSVRRGDRVRFLLARPPEPDAE
jgi:S1-C subfamily serine protease